MTGYDVFYWFYQNGIYTAGDLKQFTPFVLSAEDYNRITASKGGGDSTVK